MKEFDINAAIANANLVNATLRDADAIYRNRPEVRTAREAEARSGLAELTYQRLLQQIARFESRLDSSLEVGGRFISGPDNQPFHITAVKFSNPNLLLFEGVDEVGKPVEVIQDVSQLNLKLVAMVVKFGQEPRRLGFIA